MYVPEVDWEEQRGSSQYGLRLVHSRMNTNSSSLGHIVAFTQASRVIETTFEG